MSNPFEQPKKVETTPISEKIAENSPEKKRELVLEKMKGTPLDDLRDLPELNKYLNDNFESLKSVEDEINRQVETARLLRLINRLDDSLALLADAQLLATESHLPAEWFDFTTGDTKEIIRPI